MTQPCSQKLHNNLSFKSLSLLIAFCLAGSSLAKTLRKETHYGIAKDEDGNFLYKEKHTKTYLGKRIQKSLTSYQKKNGQEIARMESDYRQSVALPTYVFADHRRKYKEGVEQVDGKYYIFNEEAGEARKRTPLKQKENVFSCQGWHYFLVNNLHRFEKEDELKLRLILPGNLSFYNFEIEKQKAEGHLLTVELSVANFILSLFAPSLTLVYDKHNKQLVRYEGVSNITDADGDTQDVIITYNYKP